MVGACLLPSSLLAQSDTNPPAQEQVALQSEPSDESFSHPEDDEELDADDLKELEELLGKLSKALTALQTITNVDDSADTAKARDISLNYMREVCAAHPEYEEMLTKQAGGLDIETTLSLAVNTCMNLARNDFSHAWEKLGQFPEQLRKFMVDHTMQAHEEVKDFTSADFEMLVDKVANSQTADLPAAEQAALAFAKDIEGHDYSADYLEYLQHSYRGIAALKKWSEDFVGSTKVAG